MKNSTKFNIFAIFVAVITVNMIAIFLFNPKVVKADVVPIACSGTLGAETAVDEASLAGDDVLFADTGGDGYCQLDAAISAASVDIGAGVVINHADEDATGVNITTTGNFTLTGDIDVDALGCKGGESDFEDGYGPNGSGVCTISTAGAGTGSTNGGSGAGHGGDGGQAEGTAGSEYGSSLIPTFLGSGGLAGAWNDGGDGGGYVRLVVGGTTTINGAITADGGLGFGPSNVNGGGGSGGSVYISTDALAGSGSMSVDGAAGRNGSANDSGGGGGGRISVNYNTNTFNLDNITFAGGSNGGGGAEAGEQGAAVAIDVDGDDINILGNLDFEDGGDYTRNSITIGNGSILRCDSFTTLNIQVPDTLAFNNVTWTCSTIDIINIIADTLTTAGTNVWTLNKAGAQVDMDITNDITFNNLTYTGGTGGTTSSSGGVWNIDNPINIALVNSDINSSINWQGITSLNIDADSTINANYKGCSGGSNTRGDGYGPNPGDSYKCAISQASAGTGGHDAGSGGGYGGNGGDGTYRDGTFGTTYGTSATPIYLGSGGSGANTGAGGGNGGGLVRIDVTDTLTVNGNITSNGQTPSTGQGGGGSGGAVYISTNILAGSASIAAGGGTGGNGGWDGGGGGGGRAAVYYITNSGFNLSNITANLGAGGPTTGEAGDVGTVYTLQYTVPDEPTISSPDSARNITLETSAYSSNGAPHVSTSWYVCTNAPCAGTQIVWSSEGDITNLESVVANTTNGTFANDLAGKIKLAPNTNYQLRVLHTNAAGDSTKGGAGITTVANNNPSQPTNSSPSDAAADQAKNPTLTSSAYSDADSDDHGDSTWNMYESSDCSGDKVWSSVDDSTNKESILISSGTFAGTHVGEAELKGHTQYSWDVRHDDEYNGESSDSSCTNFNTLNTDPTISIADDTATEGDVYTLSPTSSDDDWNDTVTESCIESLDSSDACSLSGSDVTLSDKDTNYTCQFTCTGDDGNSGTANDTMTLSVTADNDAPAFTSPTTTAEIDENQALTILYTATDQDSASLTMAATNLPTGATLTDNEDKTASFSWTPTYDQAGEYTVTLSTTDGTNTVTQDVEITVTDVPQDDEGDDDGDDDAEEDEVINQIEDIGSLEASLKGEGKVVVKGNSGEDLCTINAWPTGGAVGYTLRLLDTYYIAVIKNRSGSTLHLYDLDCGIEKKKRLSKRKVHPREFVIRNFLGKAKSQEIAISSRRGSTAYAKIFRYNPNKDKWYKLKTKKFRPVPTGYNLKKTKKGNIQFKKNSKVLHRWKI